MPTLLKSSISLWSANPADLAGSIKAVDPYADSYHLDVSDGTLAPILLLFFSDLVKAIRPLPTKPFEAYLISHRPTQWIAPFAAASVDRIIFYPLARALQGGEANFNNYCRN